MKPKSAEDSPRHPSQVWVVDQINGRMASVEVDGSAVITVPIWILPSNAHEGDVYRVKHARRAGRSVLVIVTDDTERNARLERSAKQTSVKSKNDTAGDITL